MTLPHLPIMRFGEAYESLDTVEVTDHRTGEALVRVSHANAGLVRRDAKRRAAAARTALRRKTVAELIDISADAADRFMNDTLLLGNGTQSPDDYVQQLSATSAMPHVLVRANMEKVRYVLANMGTIVAGLTRGLDTSVIDTGFGSQGGAAVSYFTTTDALGVVLPSNSPGVNSIWMPAIALRVPVILKPGREEPWTPLRIMNALVAAGCPAEAFGFYPTDHEGADAILTECGRGIIFGDDRTLNRYTANPNIEKHGTGRSKIILGEDTADRWADYLDLIVESIAANGGRSCINASCVITPRHGRAMAEALAERLAKIEPTPIDDTNAKLAGFANVQMADWMDGAIDEALADDDRAVDLTAAHRTGSRQQVAAGTTYLRPTLVWCESFDHPLANTEFLFPFASVVELSQDTVLERIGPSLVVSAITEDPAFIERLVECSDIDRLNVGALPTNRVQWDQPHEGNLFEFLYQRRAVQRAG